MRKQIINLHAMDSEVALMFGNEVLFLQKVLENGYYEINGKTKKLIYNTFFNEEICKEIGLHRRTIDGYLALFTSYGLMEKISRGIYALNAKYIEIKD